MPSNVDLVRAFIAIELPISIRSELAVLQTNLQLKCRCPAKWVASDSIHLTLSFLGEIPYKSLEKVKQAMSQAAIGQMPLHLALYKLGAFPEMESPRIVWVGLSGGLSDLKSLQSNLAQLLRRYGLTLEEREFCPHLTLARIRDEANPHEKRQLGQTLDSAELTQHSSFCAQFISLIQSHLTPRGPLYNTLFREELRTTANIMNA